MSLNATLRPSWRLWRFKIFLLLTGILLIIHFGRVPHFRLNLFFGHQNDEGFAEGEENAVLRKTIVTNDRLEKIIHFDFKGAPPKIDYLLKLIPFLKSLGATGILIEYEDMFPYSDELEGISALNAYTLADVTAIVQSAKDNNLNLIPLIPTLGHLEFVLKLEKYKRFREAENNAETLCPSQRGSYAILRKMIDQVLKVHKYSKYLHIGCNQVEPMGVCPKCRTLAKQNAWKEVGIYLRHIRTLAGYINRTYPGVRTIVWGNEIRRRMWQPLIQNKIPDLVDIMLLNTEATSVYFPSLINTKFYSKMFPQVWIAGSYKGTEMGSVITNINHHITNVKLWVVFMEEWKTEISFKGIVFTGWQRCTHFGVLGELLPVTVPSMAVVLQLTQEGPDFDYDFIQKSLICNDFVPIKLQEFKSPERLTALSCRFPGFELYRIVHEFFITADLIKEMLIKPVLEDFCFYNVIHNEWRPAYIGMLDIREYKGNLTRLKELEISINGVMRQFYDQYTINEWITTHVTPLQMYLQAMIYTIDSLSERRVWPRRPLVNDGARIRTRFDAICKENDTANCPFVLIPQLVK